MGTLRPKKESIKKRPIFGFDIETFSKDNKFLMGSIIGNNVKFVSWDKKTLQKNILSKRLDNSLVFATNLGFDFFALFDDIRLYSKFELRMRNDRFIAIILHKENKKSITFLDTFNFLKCSVADLGKIIKLDKGKKPSFLGKKPNDLYESMELEKYNLRDSEITYKFAEFLQDSFNHIGTNIKHTLPATSMSLFRNRYLKYHIKQPKREIIKELYSGYYGGRNEAFTRGLVKDMYYYDINSLYPYVMKSYQYPFINSLRLDEKPDISLLKYEGMSLCDISAPDMRYPLLPHRYNDKLCFPIGEFSGYHTHAELRKAISLGYDIRLLKTYYCIETFNPFADFVDDLFKKRIEHQKINSPLHHIYKLCSNSLYGKFGQKIEIGEVLFLKDKESYSRFVNYCHENAERQKNNLPLRYKITSPHEKIKKTLGKNSLDETKLYYIVDLENEEYSSFINPMIAAYITSYARLELYSLIEKAKEIYYVDTDSIMTPNEMETNKELGGLKKEIYSTEGIIVKPKFYYLKSDTKEFVKSKGLSNLKTFMEFNNILLTKHFKYSKMAKFRESLKRKLSFNEIIEIEKIIDLNDNKRLWNGDFNPMILEHSRPIEIKEKIKKADCDQHPHA
jgi:hypothetical protein